VNELACFLPESGPSGWGRCSLEIRQRMVSWGVAVGSSMIRDRIDVSAKAVLSAVSDHTFQYTSSSLGKKNLGYGFIENNIAAPKMVYYANRLWDGITCGSKWMKEWLEPLVDIEVRTAIQGVDKKEFHFKEGDDALTDKPFIVGSFGKFEFRKGQDIVIKAMSIFQERHPDAVLYYNWHNQWPALMRQFAWNAHSKVRMMYSLDDQFYRENEWRFFRNTLENAGVKKSENVQINCMDLDYRSCDVILFPNRCEAGTNLCLMEALACGVPCIVTDATGHTDITREDSYPYKELLLTCGGPKTFYQGETPLGEWHEPCLDEVVSKLEQAYRQREQLRRARQEASKFMDKFTWEKTASKLYYDLMGLV
jgi:glycosyltransferase involved in cell wall biosynthesis